MKDKISQEQIISSIVTDYFDDYDFLDKVNNLTYIRKAQLRKQVNNQTYGKD